MSTSRVKTTLLLLNAVCWRNAGAFAESLALFQEYSAAHPRILVSKRNPLGSIARAPILVKHKLRAIARQKHSGLRSPVWLGAMRLKMLRPKGDWGVTASTACMLLTQIWRRDRGNEWTFMNRISPIFTHAKQVSPVRDWGPPAPHMCWSLFPSLRIWPYLERACEEVIRWKWSLRMGLRPVQPVALHEAMMTQTHQGRPGADTARRRPPASHREATQRKQPSGGLDLKLLASRRLKK